MASINQALRYEISGMHCAACSSRLERALNSMPEVEKASVNLATATAEIWPGNASDKTINDRILERVAKIGFSATPAKNSDSAAQWSERQARIKAEKKERLARLWPMIGFTIPLLLISMGHMIGMPLPAWLEPEQSPLAFIMVQFCLTVPVVWLGRHFYVEGFKALWRRAPNMDSLVAMGTGAAFLYSLVVSILAFAGINPHHQAMNLYYESCAVLLAMIELGQFLEFTARSKAGEAIGALLSVAPDKALRLDNGQPVEIPASMVAIGDRILIRPGSRAPVDGVITEGASAVDLSLLTGESIPVPVDVGDKIIAGSVNGEGSLVIRAIAVGQDTRLARIIRLVREAQGTKAPIARLADKVSFYFVPAVMLFGLLAGLAWLIFSPDHLTPALTVFVAVLVMACPCAMGLATPMSIMVGTGRGAQMGVLVKNGAALEQTGQITTLCVDKTGTLTQGKPVLQEITTFNDKNDKNLSENDMLAFAASLEGRSEHPLALAIIEAADKRGCPGLPVEKVEIKPGLGISGEVTFKGQTWHVAIGNENYIKRKGLSMQPGVEEKVKELAAGGQTPLLLTLTADNYPPEFAILSLADQLRPETPEVISKLAAKGVKVVMLTGDNAATAKAIAAKAGIADFQAQLLPAQKAEFIKSLQEKGEIVGMVGDGLNDAPALATANVGLAIGAGVDVSAEAGDIVLMSDGMKAVLAALGLSRASMRNIRQNLGWAFGYNILGLPVAAGVLAIFGGPMLSPMLAGAAMALSSFSVVTNALRLRWYKP